MSDLSALIGWLQSEFWHGFAVFLRVGAMVSLLPGFGERSVPLRIKLTLALAFCAIVTPLVEFSFTPDISANLPLFVTEPLIGLALGVSIRLFVMALQTAGSIAAQSTSLSQILGDAGAEPMPAIGHLLVISGLALAMIMGLHIRIVQLMIASYALWPLGQLPDPFRLSAWGIGNIAHSFALAFTIAAPFVVISLLYNVALGAINRAMPQLMVAFVGAPLITFGGLALLLLLSPLMLNVWHDALTLFLLNPTGGN